MTEYCISAIIPVDCQAEGLEKTLDSLFRQSLEETEILIVDCGMSELNREMVEAYQPEHENLLLLPLKNNCIGTAKKYWTAALVRGIRDLFNPWRVGTGACICFCLW